MTQVEATNLFKVLTMKVPPATHHVARTGVAAPIYAAATPSTLQSAHQLQSSVPTTITHPEPVTDLELAMQAQTIGDEAPAISNLW